MFRLAPIINSAAEFMCNTDRLVSMKMYAVLTASSSCSSQSIFDMIMRVIDAKSEPVLRLADGKPPAKSGSFQYCAAPGGNG